MSKSPEGWIEAPLASVAKVNPAPPNHIADSELVSFVPMARVEPETGRMDPSLTRPVFELRKMSYRSFANGDVIFAKVTPCMENGKVAVALGLTNGVGFGSSEFHVLRPKMGISPKYLMYFLLQKRFRADAQRAMSGTAGLLRVPSRFLADAVLPIPPTAEQERIVAAIEEEFSRLDAGVAALERGAERLSVLRDQAILALVAGAGDSHRLGDVADINLGRQRSPKNHSGPRMRPYLRAANVTWSGLDLFDVKSMNFTAAESAVYELRQGDLLVAEASGSASEVGKPAIWDGSISECCFQNTLLRVRSDQFVSRYLYYVLLASARSGTFARASKGVGIHHLSKAGLSALAVPIPPLPKQETIAAQIDEQQESISKLAISIERQIARAQNLRSSALAAAFSGELVPQDSTDEPASLLLQRISVDRSSWNGHIPICKSRTKVPHD